MEKLHSLLMKSHLLLQKEILLKAGEIGLTPGQPKILEYLASAKEVDQKTIAKNCLIEPATVGRILLGMEKGGLITRRNKENNRRSRFVSLTDMGEEFTRELKWIFSKADDSAMAELTPEERETLLLLLEKVGSTLAKKESTK